VNAQWTNSPLYFFERCAQAVTQSVGTARIDRTGASSSYTKDLCAHITQLAYIEQGRERVNGPRHGCRATLTTRTTGVATVRPSSPSWQHSYLRAGGALRVG